MKIDKIKINAYGNLENKEINLTKGINIIQGANESGKSTLLSYIVNTFYGISKNKDGKEISDFDKYKPWNSDEFSGRISYELENGQKYEVFRDFKKKNPTIYNSNLEDITFQFEVDKKDGSKFFQEQTGVDKQTYLSTVVSMQQEVRLDEKSQNILIQKIANLAGTGEDNVSYKKALKSLQDKIRDEIGTNKTTQKPINIIEKEIAETTQKIEEIKPYQNKKYNIDSEKQEIKEKLSNLEIQREILLESQTLTQEESGYIKETDIKEKSKQENTNQIVNLKKEEQEIKNQINETQININKLKSNIELKTQEHQTIIAEIENMVTQQSINNTNETNKPAQKNNPYIIIAAILAILATIDIILIKNTIIAVVLAALIGIDLISLFIKTKKQVKSNKEKEQAQKEINEKNTAKKIKLEEQKNKIEQEISNKEEELKTIENAEKELISKSSMLKGQIILLEKNNEQLDAELKQAKQKLQNMQENQKEKILEKYKNKTTPELTEQDLNNIIQNINLSNLEETINSEKIKLKGLEIEEKTIIPKLDELVTLEEKLQLAKEKRNELETQEQIINIAINNLQQAYEEMKTTITPKFTQNLSASIEKISNQKYNKVTLNDENGMIVENQRGEYIEANKLSTGTIDQLYLGLRLSMINDLSKEKLPVILDETFAYFDSERLEKALQYLDTELKEHQAIIFTCTNREKEILQKLNIKYNFINLINQ